MYIFFFPSPQPPGKPDEVLQVQSAIGTQYGALLRFLRRLEQKGFVEHDHHSPFPLWSPAISRRGLGPSTLGSVPAELGNTNGNSTTRSS